MIDPNEITDYGRTLSELEELLLFSMACAGKNSDVQSKKLHGFLGNAPPFQLIRGYSALGTLKDKLKSVGIGKYELLSQGFKQAAFDRSLNLRHHGWPYLSQLAGVGLKTAKFFLCHSRKDFIGAVLDTHILNWLRGKYPKAKIPKVPPSDPVKYHEIEAYFLAECYKLKVRPAELDLHIWKEMRGLPQSTAR